MQDKPSNATRSENFCFPVNDIQPWCYTTDPKRRWEYCPEPNCAQDDLAGLFGELSKFKKIKKI